MGQGGWRVQMALETQQRVQRTSHTPRMQHQKSRPEKPTDHGDVSKEPSGSVRAGMANSWALPLASTDLLLCLTAAVSCAPGMAVGLCSAQHAVSIPVSSYAALKPPQTPSTV